MIVPNFAEIRVILAASSRTLKWRNRGLFPAKYPQYYKIGYKLEGVDTPTWKSALHSLSDVIFSYQKRYFDLKVSLKSRNRGTFDTKNVLESMWKGGKIMIKIFEKGVFLGSKNGHVLPLFYQSCVAGQWPRPQGLGPRSLGRQRLQCVGRGHFNFIGLYGNFRSLIW